MTLTKFSIFIFDIFCFQSTFDLTPFLLNIICMICSLAWSYLLCKFATLATEYIASLGDFAYNSNWYDYPPQLQKYMVLVIARSQEPIYFSGFSLVRCTLEVFGKVWIKIVLFFLKNDEFCFFFCRFSGNFHVFTTKHAINIFS